jgi:hypothetical protein
MVIQAMDHINEILTTDSLNKTKFESVIRADLGLTKKMLNWYYNKTDHTKVYRIMMGAFHLDKFLFSHLTMHWISVAPMPQASIFQEGWMEGRLLSKFSRQSSSNRT